MLKIGPGEIFTLIKKYLPENPIIVEAGACDGRDTYQLARAFPKGTIYAFEPVPALYNALKERTKQFCNIVYLEKALGPSCQKAPFFVATKQATGNTTQTSSLLSPDQDYNWSGTSFSKTIEVDVTTLDAWAEQNTIPVIDFLWLDAQGAEYQILQGAQKMMPHIQSLWVEVSHQQRYKNQSDKNMLIAELTKQGFVAVAHDFDDQAIKPFGTMLFVRTQ